jgi:SAM-dependent methyltransferase
MTATVPTMYDDGRYLEQNPDWHLEDSLAKAKSIVRMIDKNKLSFRTCADVGCGAGGIIRELAGRYPEVNFVGYDVSIGARDFWSNNKDNRLKFFRCDFTESFDQYDLILLLDVFEHVENYMGFLRALSGRAKWFLFHIPLDMNVQGLLRDKQSYFRDTVGHLHYFSKSSALRTLSDTGYEVKSFFYTASSQEGSALKRSTKARFLNVIRKGLFNFNPNMVVKLLGGYSMLVLAAGRAET